MSRSTTLISTMGISIEQYRGRIGRFLPRNRCNRVNIKYSEVYEDLPSPSLPALWYLIVALSIFTPFLLALQQIPFIYHQAQTYSHPLYPQEDFTSSLSQVYNPSINCSGDTAPGISFSFIISCGINTLATSAFSMVTNFHSRYLYGNRRANGIKISHWNKGPGFLQNKTTEIKTIINDLHPHIIGISEANLHQHHDQGLVQLDDYTLHISPTINNASLKTSRIVVYTHQSLVVKLRPDLMCDSYPSIWMEVGLPRQKKFIVGQTYREWQLPNQPDKSSLTVPEQLNRWTVFLDQWERALDSGLEVHLLGDLNINHCNWTDPDLPASNQTSKLSSLITTLFTRILPHGVSQHVVGPTRHWPGQASSGLDHYFTNRPEKLSPVVSQHRGGSDHMLIHAVRYSRSIKASPRYIRKRSYKNFNPGDFVQAVQQLCWLDIYLCEDVNSAVSLLSSKLTFILDAMAPMRTVQIRKKYASWLSSTTLELMKERDRLQKVASETRNIDDWKAFKGIRNTVNNRLKFEEKSWQRKKLADCGEDSSKVWKNVKGILNWKSSGSPSQLFYNGSLVNKPQEVAETQNQYFLDKIRLIRENLPPPLIDPLALLRSLMVGRSCSFSFSVVHPDEVEKVMSGLSNSSSFGLDQIDTYIIKLVRLDILPALTHIVNLSLSTQEFPTNWKKSKIIPLHKKEDLLNPKNYRPIAIIPIFSKILERIVFNQMIEYIAANQLIHPNHHAYRSHHNTTTALVQLYDVWVESIQAGKLAGVCFLDMSAAFDIVDHTLLLKKLDLYGFDHKMLGWTRSYLAGRSQAVCIDGCLSKLMSVEHGVPQGSILGPLLYTLFTNELPETVHDHSDLNPVVQDESSWPRYSMGCEKCGTVACYADDTTYSCADSDPVRLTEKLSSKYMAMSDFLISNQLKLNDDKTHLMVMTTSQKRKKMDQSAIVQIRTPTDLIDQSETEKLLGAYLHQDMKWGEHILDNKESLVSSLGSRVGALKMISKVATFRNRKMIADGIFMSKLVYLIPLWGGCSKFLLKSLQTLQNKAARAVTKMDWNTPTSEILKQCGWLSVNQLSVYHTVIMAYKVIQVKSPKYLYNMFNTTYNYKTRQADSGRIRSTRTPELDLAKDSFSWRAAELFNDLPDAVRSMKTTQSFKLAAKVWIRQNIEVV